MNKVSSDVIEKFLNGNNPKKYVVAIEADYIKPIVTMIINDPKHGKYTETQKYQPFLWFKGDVINYLYQGKKMKQIEAANKFGIKTKKLKVTDNNGNIPERLKNGYKYLAICNKSYNDLVSFFKEGGIDIFDKEMAKMFFTFTPVEQFMIQTGIRMFKGMDDYNDLHRFQFDLETEGLSGKKDAIFQIGMRDNRGFEYVLETKGNTPSERRESERQNISMFFDIINELKPDTITGYNSENFDFPFLLDRAERLGLNIYNNAVGIDGKTKLKRKPAMLKLGNESEHFEQTLLYGYNVIDIAHAVRRAQAINSEIKSWSLKYITKYSEIAKDNRVYVPGDKIHSTWNDTINSYAFNDANGDWYKITEETPIKDNYTKVAGEFIVKRYLLDDLWETENVDTIYNQASFLISKLLPTTYGRSSTMGTATQWKLIMAAWSYENDLAIPETQKKRDFTGGLSRLLEVGYAKNVVKLDYAALYPKNQLTHDIFPELDISGVMKGLLTYIVDTRDHFKFLTEEHKGIIKGLKKKLDNIVESMLSKDEELKLKKKIKKNSSLKELYDKKQLPLKILANSWFGAYGAPYIFNWGDSDCAEETTCRGRQYLRLMVRFFCEKYGFKPLVLDTDGVNFSIPFGIEDIKYTAKGIHWKTEKNKDKELTGLDAVLAEFNENYMFGRMGLDIDDICESTINFARKNYANLINGKVKLVGNSIKSKKMPVYIEEFINKGIRLLLDGKGKEFINEYYEYTDMIYNYNVPLVKIASKSKVKISIDEYKKRSLKKNKRGNPLPRLPHMELAIDSNLNVNLGDIIYFVNSGSAKSHGDSKTIKDENGVAKVILNCKLINAQDVDINLEKLKYIESLKKILKDTNENEKHKIEEEIKSIEETLLKGEYNVPRYLEAFNKKVTPLLVCFHPDIRDKILRKIIKDRKTKLEKLSEKNIFTEQECVLISGMPLKPEDQDTYEELMTMEDKEIKFWDKVDKIPNNIEEDMWEKIRFDYHERKKQEKEIGVKNEKEQLDEIFKRFELDDINKIINTLSLPESVLNIVNISNDGFLISKRFEENLYSVNDVIKYYDEIIARDNWYHQTKTYGENKYDKWLEHVIDSEFRKISVDTNEIKLNEKIDDIVKNINIEHINDALEVTLNKNEEDDEEELEFDDGIDGYSPEIQMMDLNIELNNVVLDDTYEDEWNF